MGAKGEKQNKIVIFRGKIYGNLTVVEEMDRKILPSGRKERMIKCVCDCGKEVVIFLNNLVRRHNISCGCHKENLGINFFKHGLVKHPLHSIWRGLMVRCYKDYSEFYKYYGGEGVIVCDEWRLDFMKFYNWALVNGWEKGLELDKDILYIKKHGTSHGKIYSPEYCSFVTKRDNCNNRRSSVKFDYKGERLTLTEIARLNNMKWCTLYSRIKYRKMTLDQAISGKDYRNTINARMPRHNAKSK